VPGDRLLYRQKVARQTRMASAIAVRVAVEWQMADAVPANELWIRLFR
jgi:hypothetical protein